MIGRSIDISSHRAGAFRTVKVTTDAHGWPSLTSQLARAAAEQPAFRR
jgi:hypothetical protein